jgi:hypothetical protein
MVMVGITITVGGMVMDTIMVTISLPVKGKFMVRDTVMVRKS